MKELFYALSNSGDGAFIIDDQHKVIFWNAAAQKILRYTAEEALGLYCYEILGGLDEQGRTLCRRYCWVAMKAQQSDPVPSIDVSAVAGDGERTWINVTTFALPKENLGNGKMIIHLFRDANVKKRNERLVEDFAHLANRASRNSEHPSLPTLIKKAGQTEPVESLTPRQSEVLVLLSHGLGTSDIAETLSISESTARNHIQAVLNKLGVHSRLEAVAYAYQHNLIDD